VTQLAGDARSERTGKEVKIEPVSAGTVAHDEWATERREVTMETSLAGGMWTARSWCVKDQSLELDWEAGPWR